MRKLFAVIAAAALVSATAVTQVGAGVADPLTIDPTEGDVGDTIAAQVDTTLVASSCITETADAQAAAGAAATTWGGFAAAEPPSGAPPVSDYEHAAEFIGSATLGGIAADPNAADELIPNTFILSFADIGTGMPLEISSFDPDTGEGTIDVPDVDPGLYAVAATCVFPLVTQESFDAAVAAAIAQMESDLGPFDFATFNGNLATHAATYGPVIIAALMAPQDGAGPWSTTFTITAPLPPLDPQTEAFCNTLVEFAGVEDLITDALAAIPEDDGSMSDEDWASEHDWASIEETLRTMAETVQGLLDDGDETRVEAVADDWATVTDQIRDLLNALAAVDYDLSTPTGRQIAAQLTADTGGETDPAVEAATAALTEFAVTTCFPAAPTPEEPAAAPAATPTPAQPQFTG